MAFLDGIGWYDKAVTANAHVKINVNVKVNVWVFGYKSLVENVKANANVRANVLGQHCLGPPVKLLLEETKSGFHYTNLEQINSRKFLNLLFKHISPINDVKMTIIIPICFPMIFPMIFPLISHGFPIILLECISLY